MITYGKIRGKVIGRATFDKGQQYYQSGRVENFRADTTGAVHVIEGTIRGSGQERYHAAMMYSTDLEEIIDYDCDCPAYQSYLGMCKHCVALALEYMDYIQREEMIRQYSQKSSRSDWGSLMEQKGHEELLKPNLIIRSGRELFQEAQKGAGKRVPMHRIPEPQTNESVREMLRRHREKRTLPAAEADLYGKVHLEPILWCEQEQAEVEFKIGVTQMYVLKDIFPFVEAVRRQQEYRYGQKLKFVHCMEMFAPESAPLAAFVCRWADEHRKQFGQGYYSSYVLPKLRRIPLTGSELEEFLDLYGQDQIACGNTEGGVSRLTISCEAPRRQVVIREKGAGIEVESEPVRGYLGRNDWMYVDDRTLYRVPRAQLLPVQDFMDCFVRDDTNREYIGPAEVPLFCREVLPALEACFDCVKENFDPARYGVEEAVFEIYLDRPQDDMISGKIYAVYGKRKVNVCDGMEDPYRDAAGEWGVRQAVAGYFNAFDEAEQMFILTGDEEKEYALLTEGIPYFQGLGSVFVSQSLKNLRVSPAPSVKVGVSLSGGLLELTVLSEDMDMNRLAEILSRYDRKKKFYRLKSGEFVNVEGEALAALADLKAGLGLSDRQLKSGLMQIPKYRALFLDEQLRRFDGGSSYRNRNFKELIRNMKTVEDSDFEVPESLKRVLRDYQKRGFLWLKTLKWNGFGGILADDMGLGKTLQVIAFLLSEYLAAAETKAGADTAGTREPSLVVCPASLVYNWESELQRFAPELPVQVVVGTAAERRKRIAEIPEGAVVVTSYDLLKRDLELYEDISFAAEVIDEAQYIKNHLTQAAVAVKQIRAGFKLALTGTPIENRLSELWSIFDYLMPGFLYSYTDFHKNLEIPVVQHQDEEAGERLRKMVQPFILRRLKRDVLKELPDKLEEKVYAKLEGEQRALYDAHVKKLQILLAASQDPSDRMKVLAELTRLRQVCCDPALLYENYRGGSAKLELCLDLVKNAVAGGHKILLFSQFTTMLDRITERFAQEGISYYVLTGATNREKRKELVEAFQADETAVFCISLKAGGTGLNLTAADIVIHYDPWWNLAVQNQATDRTHRIGQKNVVTVYKLIARGTIEERVVELQDRKRDLADQMLAGELDGSLPSQEELLELLKESGA